MANFLQALATYTFNSNNNINLFYAGNLGRTGVNAITYAQTSVGNTGSYFVNSQMFVGWYSYTHGNLNLVPEVQYVYAKPDQQVGIPKFTSNFGATLISDYTFGKSPYSLGGVAEYFDNVGGNDSDGTQGDGAWFIAPHAEGVGVELTPTWQYKNLYVRGSVGYLHLLNTGTPAGGYGNSGTGRNVLQSGLEGGLLF